MSGEFTPLVILKQRILHEGRCWSTFLREEVLRFAKNDKPTRQIRDKRIYAALASRFSSISLRKPSRQDFQNGVQPNSIFAF